MTIQANTDTTMPVGKWEFNEEVTDVFDSMLQHSIPSYDTMRSLCFSIGERFVRPETTIIDLGASLGRAIEPFCLKFGTANDYVAYEVSTPMYNALVNNKVLTDINAHITKTSIVEEASFRTRAKYDVSLILSVLTLQFTPIEYRNRIMQNIYDSLAPGGALILVEKVLGSSHLIDTALVDIYHRSKSGNGYSDEQIAAKRKALEGVLVPLSADWNEQMMRATGFSHVECFYRHLNFAGWVAVK